MKKKNSGFTLAELLVIIAIIGIFSLTSVKSYSSFITINEVKDVKTEITELRDRILFQTLSNKKNFKYYIKDGVMYYNEACTIKMSDEGIITMLVENEHFRYYKYYASTSKTQGYDFRDIVEEQYQDIITSQDEEHRIVSINEDANKICLFYQKGDNLIVGTWDIVNDEISVESYDLYDTSITMPLFEGFNKKF